MVDVDPTVARAHLAYTGGTTGSPKGVVLTHANVVTNVLQYACHGSGSRPVPGVGGEVGARADRAAGGVADPPRRGHRDRRRAVVPRDGHDRRHRRRRGVRGDEHRPRALRPRPLPGRRRDPPGDDDLGCPAALPRAARAPGGGAARPHLGADGDVRGRADAARAGPADRRAHAGGGDRRGLRDDRGDDGTHDRRDRAVGAPPGRHGRRPGAGHRDPHRLAGRARRGAARPARCGRAVRR